MSSLILPRRFYSQPQGAVELDYDGYGYGRLLSHAAIAPNKLYDGELHTNRLFIRPSELGLVASGSGANGNGDLIWTPNKLTSDDAPRTYIVRFKFDGTDKVIFSHCLYGTTSSYYYYLKSDSAGKLQFNFGISGTEIVITSASSYTANVWHVAHVVLASNVDKRVYLDGALFASSTSNRSLVWPSNLRIGGNASTYAGTPFLTATNLISGFLVISGAMSADQVLTDYETFNPNKVFRAKPRILYFDVSTGGSAQTISVTNAAESDSSQVISALTGAISVSVGSTSSTESAQNITAVAGVKTVAVGSAAETGSSQSITAVAGTVTVAVTQATETESAQAISAVVSGATSVGVSFETDSAQTITPIPGAITVSVGSAAETESAQIISALNGLTISLGAASEIGTVGAITPVPGGVIVSLNVASETGTAQTITVFSAGTGTLDAATIAAIADAVWAHPKALTLQKFLALK